uniref:Uncharacterized protein n=1 Tax=Anopheles coluzzii TaxID=1518534 RepID=A0A8W7PHX1_ANOCL
MYTLVRLPPSASPAAGTFSRIATESCSERSPSPLPSPLCTTTTCCCCSVTTRSISLLRTRSACAPSARRTDVDVAAFACRTQLNALTAHATGGPDSNGTAAASPSSARCAGVRESGAASAPILPQPACCKGSNGVAMVELCCPTVVVAVVLDPFHRGSEDGKCRSPSGVPPPPVTVAVVLVRRSIAEIMHKLSFGGLRLLLQLSAKPSTSLAAAVAAAVVPPPLWLSSASKLYGREDVSSWAGPTPACHRPTNGVWSCRYVGRRRFSMLLRPSAAPATVSVCQGAVDAGRSSTLGGGRKLTSVSSDESDSERLLSYGVQSIEDSASSTSGGFRWAPAPQTDPTQQGQICESIVVAPNQSNRTGSFEQFRVPAVERFSSSSERAEYASPIESD